MLCYFPSRRHSTAMAHRRSYQNLCRLLLRCSITSDGLLASVVVLRQTLNLGVFGRKSKTLYRCPIRLLSAILCVDSVRDRILLHCPPTRTTIWPSAPLSIAASTRILKSLVGNASANPLIVRYQAEHPDNFGTVSVHSTLDRFLAPSYWKRIHGELCKLGSRWTSGSVPLR
jgi:hypothetical protein